MNLLYCGDSHTADGMMLSILSFMKNVPESLQIYALTMSLKTEQKDYFPISNSFAEEMDALVKTVRGENSFRRIDITEQFQRDLPLANLGTQFTPYCMMRLYADEIPDLPERILYLDYDVICRKDCREFYRQDISEYEFAGVLDYYGRWFFRRDLLRMDYQNSGVLLLNLQKIRETGLFSRCRQRCREKKMFMPDQSALNKLAAYKKTMPRRWNEQRKLQEDTVFQHFTTSFRLFPVFHTVTVKPWQEEKVHSVLHIYEYDDLLDQYKQLKAERAAKQGGLDLDEYANGNHPDFLFKNIKCGKPRER
ncbi:MAG: glycosyltransferase [Eubacteriales bacterium]|nr:glycosyltransferase [Eubacteriales bacterium]